MMTCEFIQRCISQAFSCSFIEVTGDDGVHFEALVVSSVFEGKLPLQRQRMVYATLGEDMGTKIHALSMTTLTPKEYDRHREGAASSAS